LHTYPEKSLDRFVGSTSGATCLRCGEWLSAERSHSGRVHWRTEFEVTREAQRLGWCAVAQAPLQAKIDEFAATHFAGAHVMGTHLRRRGWNKISVEQMDAAFRCVGDLRRRLPPDGRRVVLYVASDSVRAYTAAVRAMQPMGGATVTVVRYNAVLNGDVRCVAVCVCVCVWVSVSPRIVTVVPTSTAPTLPNDQSQTLPYEDISEQSISANRKQRVRSTHTCLSLLKGCMSRAGVWRSTGVASVHNGSTGRADRHLAAGRVRRAHPFAWVHLRPLRHAAHVRAAARHPAGARPVQARGAAPRLVVRGGRRRRRRRRSSWRGAWQDDSGSDGGTQAGAAHDGAVHAAADVGVVLLRLEKLLRLWAPQRGRARRHAWVRVYGGGLEGRAAGARRAVRYAACAPGHAVSRRLYTNLNYRRSGRGGTRLPELDVRLASAGGASDKTRKSLDGSD